MLTSLLSGNAALATWPVGPAPAAPVPSPQPTFTLAIMGGLSVPACLGQVACEGSSDPAPSLEGLGLFQPTPAVSVGLAVQLTRVNWQASYFGQIAGAPPATVRSTLTAGFAGVAARLTPTSEGSVSPMVLLAAGSAFQAQSGQDFGCSRGLLPTGQLGAGATSRVSPTISAFAMAAVTAGIKLENCVVSDGPPLPPIAAWGFSFQVGAAFEVGPTPALAP
ncbi:MAG TPA: hypothetical protein VFH68_02030 [Polyangia bacterium]|jgi:hypothetical protein|nr:hypothetical protein [Polyangia bacterium]